jgi:glycosyltransferase involved in cell wall biosynthesis
MKISIVTVVLNQYASIKQSLISVRSQNNSEYEQIIQDGGSTDGTLQILKQMADSKTNIVSAPDMGIYDALNQGISRASGDIIGILHSDDFYPNDNVTENVLSHFKANPNIDIVIGDVVIVNNENKIIRNYTGGKFNFNIGIMPPHPAVFIRRECYEKYGNFNIEYQIASDYDLLFRFIEVHKLKFVYSKDIIVYMKAGGISNKNIFSSINLNYEIYKIHKSHNRPISIFNLLKKIPVRMREVL